MLNFYKVFQNDFRKIYRLLLCTPYSQEEFLKACTILNDPERETKYSEIDRAIALFVRIYQGYMSKENSNTFGLNFRNSNKYVNIRNALEILYFRFEKVVLYNSDALKLINILDKEDTLFYVDPPYVETNQSGYKHKYTKENLLLLIDRLKYIKGKFVLSHYDNDWIKTYLSFDWHISSVDTLTQINCKKQTLDRRARKELIIRNFD